MLIVKKIADFTRFYRTLRLLKTLSGNAAEDVNFHHYL